jgi:hypothetical protein
MKKILFYVTLVFVTFIFTGCGMDAVQVTASSAPTTMKLPVALMDNDDALYYNKLLNQYITDPSLIPAKTVVLTEKEKREADKKMKKEFFKAFEKAGLSRQQALKAYKKRKKINSSKKTLLNLPRGATVGHITIVPGNTMMVRGKAITNKDSKIVAIVYEDDNEDALKKKYNELSTMFKKMLPASQKWKLTDEKTTAKIFRDTVTRMERYYAKYNGDYRILPDPKKYKKSIQTYRDLEKKTLKTPFTKLEYGWNSNQKVGGAIINSAMPNTISVNISLVQNKEKSKFEKLIVSFIKVLY